jgi:hypothetical protein
MASHLSPDLSSRPLQFGAGIWVFGQFVDRYAADAYGPPVDTLQAIQRAASVDGIVALDVNMPWPEEHLAVLAGECGLSAAAALVLLYPGDAMVASIVDLNFTVAGIDSQTPFVTEECIARFVLAAGGVGIVAEIFRPPALGRFHWLHWFHRGHWGHWVHGFHRFWDGFQMHCSRGDEDAVESAAAGHSGRIGQGERSAGGTRQGGAYVLP